ncbi:MAG: M23 family metallopeptidase [Pseudomonadota bacterium]|nr:M23 family metallopeptidase [Pseudomonadota bacterium]
MKYWILIATFAVQLITLQATADELGALSIRGEWQQGGVLVGELEPGARVRFLGHDVSVSDDGHFVLGIGRDAPEQMSLEWWDAAGNYYSRSFDVQQRDYRIQKINGVPQRTVTPDPKHLKRIRAEVAMTKKARADITERTDFLEAFEWPLLGPITGVYGSQRYYNGQPRRPHYGVDVAAPTGTLVRAPASGKVTLTHDDMYFSGGTLIVDHGHGLSSSFIHLSKILVTTGQEVEQGDAIAEVGATGRVTGPHLDWRMNWRDQRVDPTSLVPPMNSVRQ